MNVSAPAVPEHFSLHRTYIIFRTLGLRHLTVVNGHNSVVGIITRKDLMGFHLEEKLAHLLFDATERFRPNVELSDVNIIEGDDYQR